MNSRSCIALLAAIFLARAACSAEVLLGNEVLKANGFRELTGKRVALLTNPSGVNRSLESTIDVIRGAKEVRLVALLAPEHCIHGEYAAGREFTNHTDRRTGLPVYSLYAPGPIRKPTKRMLRGVDAVAYDIQDTGCRSYTYISTMGMAMEACGEAGVEFVVLDRPNPLGGERIEGPIVTSKFKSFVGRWDIPYVYGMTCGELARMINGEGWITNRCRLTVVPLEGWQRRMVWRDTGLPWIPSSPHVPRGESAMYQVATGMLGEIGGLNNGVGYTLPFECSAAPWLDGQKLSDVLNSRRLPGLKFLPITYTPYYGAYKGQVVCGVRLFFTDASAAPLTAVNFHILEAVKKVSKRDLAAEAAKASKNFEMFDRVNGTDATRKALQSGVSASAIVASWKKEEEAFRQLRQQYLLYP